MHGLGEPLIEAASTDAGIPIGYQGALAEPGAEVTCVGIDCHLPRILPRFESASHEVVQSGKLRPGYFDDAENWPPCGDVPYGIRDVVGSYGLEQHGRKPHRTASRSGVGYGLDELEELRRVHE